MNSNLLKEKELSYIVGIGASAGGLEALQKLLSALPENTGFPYIIIQHLSPDYKSLLKEILSKYTKMPVVQVEDGMEINANTVYVIQPGKNMRISNGKIVLSMQKEHELNLPIDMFFKSLANEAKHKAIAIVLSGTGSDGSAGIKSIKENEGLILVQDIETAKFDGMPRSAVRTGVVDAQLSPENIALELMHISQSINKIDNKDKTEKQIDDELMKKIYIILKKISNINFTHYKKTTIIRRIERRMMMTHKETLTEYVDYLYENSDEVLTLSREVLIGVTNFFRDPEYFQILKEKVVSNIILNTAHDEVIRVWVAGCSTGEEAYSIAIIFSEVMDSLKIKRGIKIFATDLDVNSISTAGKGVYSESIIESISPARLSRYFTRQNSTYVVNRDIRKMIVFSPHNVFQDPPFGKLDLISCRNMLIYFQPILQNDLFSIFHSALKNGGYLFLGKSEAIGSFMEAFPVVDANAKIFGHKSDVKIAGAKQVPYIQTSFLDDNGFGYSDDKETRHLRSERTEEEKNTDNYINTELLIKFMPACIVINDANEIVYTYGDSSNFIHLSLGKYTNIIFDVITEELKVPVSTILKEAKEKKEIIQYTNIAISGEKEKTIINLYALPINKKGKNSENLYAVIMSNINESVTLDNAIPYNLDKVASQRIIDLEQDLRDVQGKLDRSIAEQECVNEELQAANEELLTANEELQSSNEELQSVNEELYTVNSEYQQKMSELAEMNDDIANFLSSTLIGIIFVDNKLSIRRYTDYVTTEFSVMDHDIGRSLKFISYHFPTVDISEICNNVLKNLVPDEREITTSKKKVFLMRVAPYRSTENKILGCVITLVDITTQKQGLAKLQNTEEKLNLLQQDNNEKADYLSHITQEIETPMGILKGLIDLTKRNIDDKERLSENLNKLDNIVDYMVSIITNLSGVAQSDNTTPERVYEPFSIRETIDNISEKIKTEAEARGLTYSIIMDDSFDPSYIGNIQAIHKIITTFLMNAVEYTKEGNISLKVYELDNDINQATLCIIVSDTGMGISEEYLPNLFKPFTRENYNDNNDLQNMGLGLSTAYNLIKSMNGSVTVESEIDKGSKFTIIIKMKKYSVSICNTEEIKKGILMNRKALVVEDNALNRLILTTILKNEGMIIDEAENGLEALKLYNDSPVYEYDCILMDMRMPIMDGIKATMMIRDSAKEDALTIPIIGVSANGFGDDIKQAMKAGLNDYTTKPIDKEKLLAVLIKYIRRNIKK